MDGRAIKQTPQPTQKSADRKIGFIALAILKAALAPEKTVTTGTYGHETRNVQTSAVIYGQSWQPLVAKFGAARLVADGYSCRSPLGRVLAVRAIGMNSPIKFVNSGGAEATLISSQRK